MKDRETKLPFRQILSKTFVSRVIIQLQVGVVIPAISIVEFVIVDDDIHFNDYENGSRTLR